MAIMNGPAVQIKNLTFNYKGQPGTFIHQLSLQVSTGERFGIFGPNGAGKTTLMNLMTGLLRYDEGSIQLLGQEVKSHDKNVNRIFGLVPQEFSFYHELTPIENLSFFGAWAGMNRHEINERTQVLLDILGLKEVSHKPVFKFSGGMKRRVNLAIGVIHRPQILFLDEPTVGVDVQSRHAIIEYLKKLNQQGTTLVYTSHQLNEAEDLCDKITLIDEGKVIAFDELGNLLAMHSQDGLEGLFLSLTGKAYRD
jgi:ABC-2 type transport system ATP-binding protein